MDVKIEFGSLNVNWHPKSINKILRFFRYFKLVSDVEEQEKRKRDCQEELKVVTPGQGHVHVRGSCLTNPMKGMQVNAKMRMLSVTLVHPVNHTYPIATISLGRFEMDYVQSHDHE